MKKCAYAELIEEMPGVDVGQSSREVVKAFAAAGRKTSASAAKRHRRAGCTCHGVNHSASPVVGGSSASTPASGESEQHDADGTAHYTRMSSTAWGYEDFRAFIASKGQDPDAVTFSWGVTSNPAGGFWNKLNHVRAKTAANGAGPDWPVIQPAARVSVTTSGNVRPVDRSMKLAMKCADHQIGFRIMPDGTMRPFHDERAMKVFILAVQRFQPDVIQLLGDFLDLASQGRFAQEAAFARSTQPALDAGHRFLAELRAAAPNARIILIEGNHDKRMQNFIEANALAAFGLKRANMPDDWPALSLPNLLRLDELGIQYIDAYPAATDWDNDLTRNIHGTKANSKGSTTAQYVAELPHINTWAGHTHRLEITYSTVLGARGKAVESYSANPGCMCLTDGSVPSVRGAIGSDGTPAQIVEDWQQGFGMAYYTETESWPFVYRIRDGRAIVDGHEIAA